MSRTMPAVVARRPGGPGVLEVVQLPIPEPRAGEVRVRVRAAGVNASDRHVRRSGAYLRVLRMMRGEAIAGLELAGTVDALGPGVTGLAPGDAVWGAFPGSRHGGSYAGYAVMSAGWVGRMPAGLSFEEAAGAPVGGMTALHMLALVGAGPGARILVNGASGAIGAVAVQAAKAMGCHVTGTCSARNVERVRALGADRVLDYARDRLADAGPVEGIVDAAGLPAADALALLPPGGAFATAVFAFGTVLRLRLAGRRAFAAMVTPSTAALDALAALVERGLRVPVARVFPLAEAGAAQAELERGHPGGRVVLRVEVG